jgi:muramoyltetrapeptide carboxypeptidase
MIIPPYLKPGDRVSIVSPAKVILEKEIVFAVEELKKRDLIVELGKNVFGSWNRFSGTDSERLSDVQNAFDNPEIKAVFFARGGYGSVRIIDNISFTKFIKKPKWLVGYSDITVFHQHVNSNFGIATCHGTMPLNMIKSELNHQSTKALIDLLFNIPSLISCNYHKLNNLGKTKSEIVGGNLSVLCSLIGTNSFIDPAGRILFIEDICEELYHLDRMMFQLKKTGILNKLEGLIVGGFTGMTDVSGWFDKQAYDIINDYVREFNYPKTFGFPSGHTALNLPLIFGQNLELVISNNKTSLK